MVLALLIKMLLNEGGNKVATMTVAGREMMTAELV
jgi:hypothetical protein